MELRVIENFITVIQEGNISRAAEVLHVTQPTLSRQLKDLESEIGSKLFNRGSREITLTEEGRIFLKRAKEIIDLVKRTQEEIKRQDTITGDIYIGAGESQVLEHLGKIIKLIQNDYPEIRFHIISGDKVDLLERLDNGLFDFCLIFSDFNRDKYNYLELPYKDHWVLIAKKDFPIATKTITLGEISDLPLLFSRQSINESRFEEVFKVAPENLNIVATYNLVHNAVLLAEQGVGAVVTLDHLVNINGTDLVTRKIVPDNPVDIFIIWKKNSKLGKLQKIFLDYLNEYLKNRPPKRS